jgi:hypothetical protein
MTHYAHPDRVLAAVNEIASQVGVMPHVRTLEADARAIASESGV